MKELITISDGELRLTSNLDEYSFGKTNYDSIVTQEGLLFDGKNFTSWTFSDVKSFEDPDRKERIVFFYYDQHQSAFYYSNSRGTEASGNDPVPCKI